MCCCKYIAILETRKTDDDIPVSDEDIEQTIVDVTAANFVVIMIMGKVHWHDGDLTWMLPGYSRDLGTKDYFTKFS